MRTRITVTQADINRAKKAWNESQKSGVLANRAATCPIAQSFKRRFPNHEIRVDFSVVYISNDINKEYSLPLKAREFIDEADSNDDNVDPISFLMEI